MTSPLLNALGYGWQCPYCHVAQDEGNQTGVYYFGKAVCARCAPILDALRDAAKKAPA
jgi:recombinational DNA repair protein (RecF pathway)